MTVNYSSFTQITILMMPNDGQSLLMHTDSHSYNAYHWSVTVHLHRFSFFMMPNDSWL